MAYHGYAIISERVTNLSIDQTDLVHCPICGFLLWKPVACNLCENAFCFQCIQTWLLKQQEEEEEQNDCFRCPFNCWPFQQRKCPPLLISILSKLTIECRNKSYGCEEILLYEQLEKHEEEFCPFQIVQCPGCKLDMFKEIFYQDDHLSKCLYVDMECIKCQTVFKRKDQHDLGDCLERRISSLTEQMFVLEEKAAKRLDILRQRMESLEQSMKVIEDDKRKIDKPMNSVLHSIQLLNFRSIGKRGISIGIQLLILAVFTLFIYTRIFFS